MKKEPGNPLNLGTIEGTKQIVSLTPAERARHLYVVGSTGTGKSRFLAHLLRQDILNWSRSKCGLLLLDPHGELYDLVVPWLAFHDLKRPIVCIDLRQDEWVVSFNLLRKARGDPAVRVAAMVQCIAHAFKVRDLTSTPRLQRWLSNVGWPLQQLGLTLPDARYLLNFEESLMRRAIVDLITNPDCRADWQELEASGGERFREIMESAGNRLRAFVNNSTMKATLGQEGVSLDLRRAIDEGWIILVSLAADGERISDEDARLFATFLLTDLWAAVRGRGKRDGIKPFYLFADEFQEFLMPTIAKNLAQARGYGLHLTLAHQYPGQLRNDAAYGREIFDAVMSCARTKVSFQLEGEDGRTIAPSLFTGVMDPDQVKHQPYSTKVLAYQEVIRRSRTHGMSTTESDTETDGRSGSETSDGDRGGWQSSESVSVGTGHSESTTESTVREPIMGKEASAPQFRSLEEQRFKAEQILFCLKKRHAVCRIVDNPEPLQFVVPMIEESFATEKLRRLYINGMHKQWKWDFVLPGEEARRRLEERDAQLRTRLLGAAAAEPETAKHSVSLPRAKRKPRA